MAPALLALIFQSHAVLQRNVPIPIYGFIPSGAVVNVEFAGITLSTVADSTGRWAALFPAMSAGGPFTLSANASTGARGGGGHSYRGCGAVRWAIKHGTFRREPHLRALQPRPPKTNPNPNPTPPKP